MKTERILTICLILKRRKKKTSGIFSLDKKSYINFEIYSVYSTYEEFFPTPEFYLSATDYDGRQRITC